MSRNFFRGAVFWRQVAPRPRRVRLRRRSSGEV